MNVFARQQTKGLARRAERGKDGRKDGFFGLRSVLAADLFGDAGEGIRRVFDSDFTTGRGLAETEPPLNQLPDSPIRPRRDTIFHGKPPETQSGKVEDMTSGSHGQSPVSWCVCSDLRSRPGHEYTPQDPKC
jgi:hypothetical protein